MNILLIGSGGREHALAWKISQSPLVSNLYACPGNPGIEQYALLQEIDLANHAHVIAFCTELKIELVVVGPEQPLVDGLADALATAGINCFGPSRAAAQLEGSKGFTKDMCTKAGIPTAAYHRYQDKAAAVTGLAKFGLPVVIKADGLAAGKGVVIAETAAEALAALDHMFGGGFGDAGAAVVIEEFMTGEEASFFALTDGTTALPFGTAQDHKRVGDGDTGPNTGGMGAYSPATIVTPALSDTIMQAIIQPTVDAMRMAGTPYVGVLFAGLMLTADGPKLIEYNCRFGDPECQVLMLRLTSDIVPLLLACCTGTLEKNNVTWTNDKALTVVMAANGYPGTPLKGSSINNVAAADACDGVTVFQAGTDQTAGQLRATGGRVLNVSAIAATVEQAANLAYCAVDMIDWPGGFCRRDIGQKEIMREKTRAAAI
jgi:phosphoribosylamine---glycine ligase